MHQKKNYLAVHCGFDGERFMVEDSADAFLDDICSQVIEKIAQ